MPRVFPALHDESQSTKLTLASPRLQALASPRSFQTCVNQMMERLSANQEARIHHQLEVLSLKEQTIQRNFRAKLAWIDQQERSALLKQRSQRIDGISSLRSIESRDQAHWVQKRQEVQISHAIEHADIDRERATLHSQILREKLALKQQESQLNNMSMDATSLEELSAIAQRGTISPRSQTHAEEIINRSIRSTSFTPTLFDPHTYPLSIPFSDHMALTRLPDPDNKQHKTESPSAKRRQAMKNAIAISGMSPRGISQDSRQSDTKMKPKLSKLQGSKASLTENYEDDSFEQHTTTVDSRELEIEEEPELEESEIQEDYVDSESGHNDPNKASTSHSTSIDYEEDFEEDQTSAEAEPKFDSVNPTMQHHTRSVKHETKSKSDEDVSDEFDEFDEINKLKQQITKLQGLPSADERTLRKRELQIEHKKKYVERLLKVK